MVILYLVLVFCPGLLAPVCVDFEDFDKCNKHQVFINIHEQSNHPYVKYLKQILDKIQNDSDQLLEILLEIAMNEDKVYKITKASEQQLLFKEIQTELYEQKIINQLRINKAEETLLNTKLHKIYIPKNNCLTSIFQYLEQIEEFINNQVDSESINNYHYTRDLLNYRTEQCYTKVLGIKEIEVDLMNQTEIDQFEIEQSEEHFKEWEEVKKWLEIMDFKIFYWESEQLWEKNPEQMQQKIGRWLKRVSKGVNKLRTHFKPLINLIAEKRIWYEKEVELRRDNERHLKSQIKYNWISFKQDESNHDKMVIISSQLIEELETIKNTFSQDLDPAMQELLKSLSSQNLDLGLNIRMKNDAMIKIKVQSNSS